MIGQVLATTLLYLASQYGALILYALGAMVFTALVVTALWRGNSTRFLLFTVILSFFAFRYLAIAKYVQPLFDDPWSDLRTATFFADANQLVTLPIVPNVSLVTYSLWPMLHLLSLTISRVFGISLLDAFTFFGPIIAFPSLLFVYLTTLELFGDSKKAAAAALIFSTFSIPMFWQMQVVRQNLGLTIFCGGFYTYARSRKRNENSTLVLALFFFSILPLVHHITALVAVVTLGLAFVLERTYWHERASIGFPIFVGTVTLLTWAVLQGGWIVPALFNRLLDLFVSTQAFTSPKILRLLSHFDLFDLLAVIRILCLAFVAFLGFATILRFKIKFGGFLSALFIGSGLPLFLAIFVSRDIDERFALLVTLPAIFLVTYVGPRRRLLLVLLLIFLVAPTPFKLYETTNATPTYVFDSNASVNFSYGEFSKFRGPDVMTLARWNARYNDGMPVLADEYDAQVIQQYYNPVLIYFIAASNPSKVSYYPKSDLLVFFNYYFTEGRYGEPVLIDLRHAISNSSIIYSDGSQIGYYVG